MATDKSKYIDQSTGKLTGHPNDPNDYIPVMIIRGTDKGKLTAIHKNHWKRDFKQGYHKKLEENVAVSEENMKDDSTMGSPELGPVDESKARFEELKAQRAWLKPDLKEEYNRLKEIHG